MYSLKSIGLLASLLTNVLPSSKYNRTRSSAVLKRVEPHLVVFGQRLSMQRTNLNISITQQIQSQSTLAVQNRKLTSMPEKL